MEKIKKIDMHLHAMIPGGPERLRGGTWPTPAQVREVYDLLNIEKGVEMARLAPERSHDPITSRDAALLAKEYPDTIGWWFCYLDPRMGTNSSQDDLTYYIDFYKERGAKGVGEMQANLYLDDPRIMNLLSACEKCSVPVTIHFGVKGVGCGFADDIGLPRLEKILCTFPKLKILGHAQAFWSEITDGIREEMRNSYSTGRIIKEGRLSALMRKYPNLYCDLSAESGYNAISRDREFGIKFLEEFNERIFYGTDLSAPKIAVARGDVQGDVQAGVRSNAYLGGSVLHMAAFLDDAVDSGELSVKAYENICRRNAEALLCGEL